MVNKAAQALGKMAAGKPKNFSAAERKRRADRLAAARVKRWPSKSNTGVRGGATASGTPSTEQPCSALNHHKEKGK